MLDSRSSPARLMFFCIRRVEKMLFLFFDLGQAREARSGKSRFLWHGERPSG
jgi:hypothetical protein